MLGTYRFFDTMEGSNTRQVLKVKLAILKELKKDMSKHKRHVFKLINKDLVSLMHLTLTLINLNCLIQDSRVKYEEEWKEEEAQTKVSDKLITTILIIVCLLDDRTITPRSSEYRSTKI